LFFNDDNKDALSRIAFYIYDSRDLENLIEALSSIIGAEKFHEYILEKYTKLLHIDISFCTSMCKVRPCLHDWHEHEHFPSNVQIYQVFAYIHKQVVKHIAHINSNFWEAMEIMDVSDPRDDIILEYGHFLVKFSVKYARKGGIIGSLNHVATLRHDSDKQFIDKDSLISLSPSLRFIVRSIVFILDDHGNEMRFPLYEKGRYK
jgi:hypothetical protein